MKKVWLDKMIPRIPEIAGSEAAWVIVGALIVALYLKFPINWDAVFGWR